MGATPSADEGNCIQVTREETELAYRERERERERKRRRERLKERKKKVREIHERKIERKKERKENSKKEGKTEIQKERMRKDRKRVMYAQRKNGSMIAALQPFIVPKTHAGLFTCYLCVWPS